MGNLRSVAKALEKAGAETCVTASPDEIRAADAVVFPGVGAFGAALEHLKKSKLLTVIEETIARDKPFLGLCLGFQLLFDHSTEDGNHAGLGIIPGAVKRFSFAKKKGLKVPHMGWNNVIVSPTAARTMFKGIPQNTYFYFVHSYYGIPKKKADTAGTTVYGIPFCAAVVRGNVWGCQFHPEKSSTMGLQLLKNFVQKANVCR